ncbi:Kinetochore protein Spc24 [Malassezia obtusa]|uniref:Kinetochore protein Spc24 n=1 Tax=Malassezia obtusa TaxID=76774 RepID=A0AAF0E1V6_9BASI|nr:Kinetochore protein Spc24 [Malassezia obtusa]
MEGSLAERYRELRRRAELEKEHESSEESESESDVTEDEEGEQLTPQVDAAILRTLQKIRSKDPALYQSDTRIFDQEREQASKHALPEMQKQSSKKLTLQDYQRQRLQEAMETESDPARAFAEATTKERTKETAPVPSHDEEQESIRNEFLSAVPEDDEGDLFQVRRDQDPENTYRTALIGALDGGDEGQVRKLLRDSEAKDDQGLSKENEDFLLNYVLNRGWVDKEKPQKEGARDWDAEAAELDSEASFDSAADAFEHAYNFRFEDPSLAQQNFAIQSFPRQATDSVRRSDDRRKIARQERAERKKQEKEEKKRKLDQIKSQKRKSIAEKLKQLRDVAGGDNQMDGGAFEGLDLEADFDPDEHDRLMQSQFGDDYYQVEDRDKPRWDEDDELQGILEENEDGSKKKRKSKKHDDNDTMDADFVEGEAEAKLSKKDRKRLKKQEKKARSKADQAQADQGVDADEMDAEKTSGVETEQDRKAKARELMDEYYNLGYEDIVGDVPTRFKYASVPKENFGMSAVEILLADDAELNQVVGLKHIQPYRRNAARPTNLNKKLKRFREQLQSKWDEETTNESEEPPKKKKRLGKKERAKLKQQQASETPQTE